MQMLPNLRTALSEKPVLLLAAAERARAALAAQNEELRRQAQLLAEQAREQANVKANNDRFTFRAACDRQWRRLWGAGGRTGSHGAG